MRIRLHSSYAWESNRVGQKGSDQQCSIFLNDNQTTYKLGIREQQGRTDRQRSAPFWIPQWQSDHLHSMNKRATELKRSHFELLDDNQTTYFLWMRKQQGRTDRQYSAPSWILQLQSVHSLTITREEQGGTDRQRSASLQISQWSLDHLQSMNKSGTGWNIHAEISTILNSLIPIRPHTVYEWEQQGGTYRQLPAPFCILQ